MSLRNISSLLALSCFIALVPSACGGDSSDDDGSAGGSGDAGEGGSSAKGGSSSGGSSGKGGSAGSAGSAGKGGTAGRGGTSSTGGSGGDAGAGDGGLGGVGGEPGAAGEGGAGGQPGCTIANDATVSGTLKITADDNFRLYVNGALIDETPRLWYSPQTYTVTLFRHPSRKNVLAVEGINVLEISGMDRVIIADLSFDAGAGVQSVVTDTSWKLSATTPATDWFAIAFNDAAWVASFDQGPQTMAPYGGVLGTSNARLIWAYDSNVAATAKPDPPEHVFVRKSFYVNEAGTVTSTPSACP